MESTALYYQESGKTNPMGISLALIAGLAAASVLGFVYAYATFYIPFIYFNFLLTYFFGFSIGYAVGKVGSLGKVRNSRVLLLSALAMGVIGIFFAWVFWISAASGGELMSFNMNTTWFFIQLIAMEGAWSIFGFTPTGGALYLIWIVEAGIILFGVIAAVGAGMGSKPYCESCDQWLNTQKVTERVRGVANPIGFRKEMEGKNYDALKKLPEVTLGARNRTCVQLSCCPGCSNQHYLTVDKIERSTDSDGDAKENTTRVLENLRIDRLAYEDIMEWGKQF
ncbi:MAG: hypothetical protein HRU41_32285 [Saprospiraceae bacterium]|nr:hypothetical protein [Saprospiraceae bacterium]